MNVKAFKISDYLADMVKKIIGYIEYGIVSFYFSVLIGGKAVDEIIPKVLRGIELNAITITAVSNHGWFLLFGNVECTSKVIVLNLVADRKRNNDTTHKLKDTAILLHQLSSADGGGGNGNLEERHTFSGMINPYIC